MVTKTVLSMLYADDAGAASSVTIKNISGNSGAQTYGVMKDGAMVYIVKVVTGEGISGTHPASSKRFTLANEAMCASGIAPKLVGQGGDFHIEEAAGSGAMKDYFHFDWDKLTPTALATLLAKIHASPTDWYTPLREEYIKARDPKIAAVFTKAPPQSPGWNLPMWGLETGWILLGVGGCHHPPPPHPSGTLGARPGRRGLSHHAC